MANLIWSIALAAIGIVGLWLAGSQRRAGWAIGVGAQLLWIGFALVSGQYGFIASALAYGFVYARNYRRARARRVNVRLSASIEHHIEAMRRFADVARDR